MLTGADGRIAAVLDWELCTLGDPLADVGYLMNNWAEPGESGRRPRAAPRRRPPWPAASRAAREMLDALRRSSRAATSRSVDYYRAFQYWRLAAIVEGVHGALPEGRDGQRRRH